MLQDEFEDASYDEEGDDEGYPIQFGDALGALLLLPDATVHGML